MPCTNNDFRRGRSVVVKILGFVAEGASSISNWKFNTKVEFKKCCFLDRKKQKICRVQQLLPPYQS